MQMSRRVVAEFIGTFWLVLGGCGSAVLAAAFPGVGIGLLGVAFAFGLTVLTMAYAIGHISGCHLNPAVSVGLVVGGRFKASELVPYIIAQVLGAIVAAGAVVVSGGTLAAAIAGAAIAGGTGGLIGSVLATWVGDHHARYLERQLEQGGLLLWVRTWDSAGEALALAVLKKHSGDRVHVHCASVAA